MGCVECTIGDVDVDDDPWVARILADSVEVDTAREALQVALERRNEHIRQAVDEGGWRYTHLARQIGVAEATIRHVLAHP